MRVELNIVDRASDSTIGRVLSFVNFDQLIIFHIIDEWREKLSDRRSVAPDDLGDLLLLFIAFPGANGLSAQHFGAL